MFNMTRKDLSPEKQKKYDEIVNEMMEDIERRKAEQQPLGKSQLSCAYGNKPYADAEKIYLSRLQELLDE